MATSFTTILKLALPATGELAGTWGDVVNQNITSMVEEAIAGLATINTWVGASHTLTTANGTTAESRCAILELSGTPGGAATVICPDATKIYIVRNEVDGGFAATIKTAAGTGVTIPNNRVAVVYCDGTDVKVASDFFPSVDIQGGTITGATVTSSTVSNSTITTPTLSGGTIDNTPIGGTTPSTGAFTTATATTGNITTVNATTVDTTNIEVTNIKAKDGTAAGSIANSTGVVTLASSVLTTTDINGGSVNATAIGDVTPSTGAFTDFTASGTADFTSTGAVKLPVGTEAQRPTPAAGMLRFNDDTDEFEGYNGTAWSSVGGSAITNDTTTSTDVFPLFADATTGTAANVFTSNAKLLYKPSTGEFKSEALVATNGIVVNSATIDTNYTIVAGTNGHSVGPVTVDATVTVDGVWLIS